MLKCPNHELSNDIIVNNFYARLSRHDKDMLDASSLESFTSQNVNAKWDLIERIYRNADDWEIDKGKETGINYEYDCIKSLVETESFNVLSAKFGLDPQIGVDFCKSFATHINIPKEKWNKYQEPFKDVCRKDMLAKNKIQVHTVQSFLPVVHFEKPPFPIRIKEHSTVGSVVNKSEFFLNPMNKLKLPL